MSARLLERALGHSGGSLRLRTYYLLWCEFDFLGEVCNVSSVALDESSFKSDTDRNESVPGFDVIFSPAVVDKLRQTPAAGFSKAYSVTKATGIRTVSLRSLITSFHKAQTKDPRDMIYGLLALAEPSHGITPNYSKSAAEIYAEVIEASLWKQPVSWWGTDDYLASFSQLVQWVLGEPFWEGERPKCLPEAYDKHKNLVVTGILGKRISWGNSPSKLSLLNVDEIETLSWKQQAWLELSTPTKHIRNFSPICGNRPPKPRTFYRQKFNITPYCCNCGQNHQQDLAGHQPKASHSLHRIPNSISQNKTRRCPKHNTTGDFEKEEGSALLSTPSTNEDYLCFFKDCDVAAVVRGNQQGNYSVVGHCVIDFLRPLFERRGASIGPLEDWTMKCEVEMSRETLQRLTM